MRRLFQVFCLTLFLLLFTLSASYADADGLISTQMSPELQDSLDGTKGKEPTLQEVLDGLGYSIDVENDRLPTEIWVALTGQYSLVMLAELSEYSDQTASGWYGAGSPSDTHMTFTGSDTPPDTEYFYITGCDSNGLFIAPFEGEGICRYMYYTQPHLNADKMDHAWVYCSGQRPNEFIIAWEDRYRLIEADFQDLVLLYRMPNRPPILSVPDDTSFDLCQPEIICFGPIDANDEDYCDTLFISMISGPGIFEGDSCCFMPADVDSTYEFVFVATDWAGDADTQTVVIQVEVNQPPQLTCPEDDSVNAEETFVSSDFSVVDPDGDSAPVTFLDINPSATNDPTVVDSHVEWVTTLSEEGDYTIRLVATDDPCGLKDTCEFMVKVIKEPTGELTCPDDDSVHAGETFASTSFTVTYPECDSSSVKLLDINPSATNVPTIVGNHVEWVTTCAEDGDYVIRLMTDENCSVQDTCEFIVTVYNRPPELTCPEDDSVNAEETFVSSDFSVVDPDGDSAPVIFLDINPSATNDPTVVDSHVEWVTTFSEEGDYTIRLVATDDPCGLKDTCEFMVTVIKESTGELTCPDDDSAHAGETFASTDFSISGPGAGQATVTVCGVNPTPNNMPFIVESHVEWETECEDTGKVFSICLEANFNSEAKDTCCFQVTVYNRPPEIICPEDDSVYMGDEFVSTDFLANDPDSENVSVTVLDIYPPITDPPPPYYPVVVEDHVEWITINTSIGRVYSIRLVATDGCGLKDTCAFKLKITLPPHPGFAISVKPDTQYVTSGQAVGYVVMLHSILTFHEACSLFVSGLPDPPAIGIFNKAVLIPTDSTTLIVYTTTETDTGWYTLTITGKEISGSIQRIRQVHLRVLESTDAGDWDDNPNSPKGFALFQNQPNPFNPETRISYYLPRDCPVKLTIYNVLGQRVRTLFDGHQHAGIRTLIWDGRDNGGAHLSSGIYFYRLQADDFYETKKMVLMK